MADKTIPLITAQKTPASEVKLDPAGFFVIEVDHTKHLIRVEWYDNVTKNNRIVSGKLHKVIIGDSADAICDTLAKEIPSLLPEHYLYLGRELQRAYEALQHKITYEQGGC